MDWYALTHLGAEQALAKELEELGAQPEPKTGGCAFSASKQDAAHILYHLQCATRLLAAVDEGSFEELDASKAHEHIPEDATFRASVDTLPAGPKESSTELASMLGDQVERDVDLEEPDYTLYCQAAAQCLLGIDVAGDLSKRYYRVFANSQSNKGTLAASILYHFGIDGHVLDPFANTGEVVIEQALRVTNTSPLRYQKHQPLTVLDDERKDWEDDEHEPETPVTCFEPLLGNLNSCKKNAKLAGVEKAITFSKLDPEWIDIKFGEAEIDAIVTIPPPVTNRNPDSEHLKELCYQAEFIITEEGCMLVACKTEETMKELAKHAKTYKLRLADEVVIHQGELPVHVMRYEL